MFDLTSSKLLILGVVALIVVGPKELPFLLRTVGKYVAMIRRQANEFRAQFDEAMREAELDGIKKDLEAVARDTENTIRSAQTSFEHDIHKSTADLDQSLTPPVIAPPAPMHQYDPLNGVEVPASEPTAVADSTAPAVADIAIPRPAPETVAAAVPHAPHDFGTHEPAPQQPALSELAAPELAAPELAPPELAPPELAKTGT